MEIIIILLVFGVIGWLLTGKKVADAKRREREEQRENEENLRLRGEMLSKPDFSWDEYNKLLSHQERQDREIEERREIKMDEMLREVVVEHFDVLQRKYIQLISKDDYGLINKSAWYTEMKYFQNKACPVELIDMYKHHWGDVDYQLMLVTKIEMEIDDILEAMDSVYEAMEFANPYTPDMSGIDFEHHVADRFRALGALVRYTAKTGDQGIDLIVEGKDREVAIQCKRSARPVGNSAIQQAAAGKHFYGASEAWVISDASFTKSARQLAATLSVTLVHFEDIAVQFELSS